MLITPMTSAQGRSRHPIRTDVIVIRAHGQRRARSSESNWANGRLLHAISFNPAIVAASRNSTPATITDAVNGINARLGRNNIAHGQTR